VGTILLNESPKIPEFTRKSLGEYTGNREMSEITGNEWQKNTGNKN